MASEIVACAWSFAVLLKHPLVVWMRPVRSDVAFARGGCAHKSCTRSLKNTRSRTEIAAAGQRVRAAANQQGHLSVRSQMCACAPLRAHTGDVLTCLGGGCGVGRNEGKQSGRLRRGRRCSMAARNTFRSRWRRCGSVASFAIL